MYNPILEIPFINPFFETRLMQGIITITFGEQAENHVGMQKLGDGLAQEGFTPDDLKRIKTSWVDAGHKAQLITLNKAIDDQGELAKILILRNAADVLLGLDQSDSLYTDLKELKWDKKALMYGRVVNKTARWNLCFGTKNQDPSYEEGKGRIVAFKQIDLLRKLRLRLPKWLGPKATKLQAEGNYYYNTTKCGIGYHGDSERLVVVGLRLGESGSLYYKWHKDGKQIGPRIEVKLHHGDIYIMSEKATGNDWKKKSILTLRHAAGADKYSL